MEPEPPIMRRILDMIALPDPSYEAFWKSLGLPHERGRERLAMDLEWGRESIQEDKTDHDLDKYQVDQPL